MRGHVYSTGMNQSVVAVTNRLLGRSELAPNETPVALVDLDDGTVVWIQRVLMLGIVALLGWSCRGRLRDGEHASLLAEWSLVGAATLALSGYTWTGHFCLLIPAQVVLFAFLSRPERGRRDRLILGFTLAAQGLFVFTSDLVTQARTREPPLATALQPGPHSRAYLRGVRPSLEIIPKTKWPASECGRVSCAAFGGGTDTEPA